MYRVLECHPSLKSPHGADGQMLFEFFAHQDPESPDLLQVSNQKDG